MCLQLCIPHHWDLIAAAVIRELCSLEWCCSSPSSLPGQGLRSWLRFSQENRGSRCSWISYNKIITAMTVWCSSGVTLSRSQVQPELLTPHPARWHLQVTRCFSRTLKAAVPHMAASHPGRPEPLRAIKKITYEQFRAGQVPPAEGCKSPCVQGHLWGKAGRP